MTFVSIFHLLSGGGFVSAKEDVNCEWEQGQEKPLTIRCFYKLTLSYNSPVEKESLPGLPACLQGSSALATLGFRGSPLLLVTQLSVMDLPY